MNNTGCACNVRILYLATWTLTFSLWACIKNNGKQMWRINQTSKLNPNHTRTYQTFNRNPILGTAGRCNGHDWTHCPTDLGARWCGKPPVFTRPGLEIIARLQCASLIISFCLNHRRWSVSPSKLLPLVEHVGETETELHQDFQHPRCCASPPSDPAEV